MKKITKIYEDKILYHAVGLDALGLSFEQFCHLESQKIQLIFFVFFSGAQFFFCFTKIFTVQSKQVFKCLRIKTKNKLV